jgi:hypothetical protein
MTRLVRHVAKPDPRRKVAANDVKHDNDPLGVINEVVERIRDRSILNYRYEPETGGLRENLER